MKIWVTRDEDDRFWWHFLKPIIKRMKFSRKIGVFEQPGDPFRLPSSLCEMGTRMLLNRRRLPPKLRPTQFEIKVTRVT